MKKDKFITVMAIFDDNTQELMRCIQDEFEREYGPDTKTKGIPFHITLGSYAVEETETITSRIVNIAKSQRRFDVKFIGLNHFGNTVRYIEPEMCDDLMNLHKQFDSDYANGYSGWKPHATVYRHSKSNEMPFPARIDDLLNKMTNSSIVGIELGEFFPPKQIIRVLFHQ